ncbi:hypothetical protein [Candidimonas nitroreducens]|uniref:hypothetical protein n=1 Tax=Candidimonas nitroreducens TaxID=683354 RepID=UPI0018E9F59E|nr:hypothetical protein [Candidimonas nitroreducens]
MDEDGVLEHVGVIACVKGVSIAEQKGLRQRPGGRGAAASRNGGQGGASSIRARNTSVRGLRCADAQSDSIQAGGAGTDGKLQENFRYSARRCAPALYFWYKSSLPG